MLIDLRQRGREGERGGKNIDVRNIDWFLLHTPQLRTKPGTQACALPRNQTHDLSVYGMSLQQLRHTIQCLDTVYGQFSIRRSFYLVIKVGFNVSPWNKWYVVAA